jgi:hypothetical protein
MTLTHVGIVHLGPNYFQIVETYRDDPSLILGTWIPTTT